MWPKAISRTTLDPYYARAELGLRVQRPTWDQVSKSGGLWAATLAAAGHTCDRVPLAISPERCVNAKWCHTGCIFGAKNSLITNYLWAAENAGVRVLPNLQVEQISAVERAALPLRGRGRRDGQRGAVADARADRPAGADRVQGAGPGRRRDGQRRRC